MCHDIVIEPKVRFCKEILGLWYSESVSTSHLDVGEEISRQVFEPPKVISIKFIISVSVTLISEETSLKRHGWEVNLILSDCVLASVSEINFLTYEPESSFLIYKPLIYFFI